MTALFLTYRKQFLCAASAVFKCYEYWWVAYSGFEGSGPLLQITRDWVLMGHFLNSNPDSDGFEFDSTVKTVLKI